MRTTKEERAANRVAVDSVAGANRIALLMDVEFVRQLLDDADAAAETEAVLKSCRYQIDVLITRDHAAVDALTTIATAAGLPADASAEVVAKRVGELKWMVSAICTDLLCNKEMPVPDVLTIERIDGITRKRDPGPFGETVFAEEAGRG